MTEHYGDDLYAPADLEDTSYDPTLSDPADDGAPLWETETPEFEALDAVPTEPGVEPLDPAEVPPAPELPDYTDPSTDVEDPYAVPTDAEDPYSVPSDVEDPYATPTDGEDPWAPVDPNDPNVGLDPSDPSYDHYYAEHGHVYEGPSDVSADGSADPLEVPQGGDVPLPEDDYNPDNYTPVEYPYEDPFQVPGHDTGYDPYAEPDYDPYAEGAPYGGGYDAAEDPCYGDHGYDPYTEIYVHVEVDVTVTTDVYDAAPADAPADPYETPVSDEETVPYEGYDPEAEGPYESYGPMEVTHFTPDWSPTDFDGAGEPLADGAYFHEVADPANAPLVTEGQIIEKLTGTPVNEAALAQQAENAGFFDPVHGMDGGNVGSLLELHGIETETVYDADLDTLINALESGDPVMAVVDTNETGMPMHDVVTGQPVEQYPPALSSVWVTGVDVQPDGSVYVLVNDPSWPNGQTMPIEISDFANAWADGGNQAVIAHAQ